MEEQTNHLVYLVIDETNNGGAGAKRKLWLEYINGLSGSNKIETNRIKLN